MTKSIIFIIITLISAGIFSYTISKIRKNIKITRDSFPIDRIGERIWITLLVAFGQSKIMRRPVIGFMHALVWWGFIVITIGTGEIILDGLFGTERMFGFLGPVYDVIMASGDISAMLIFVLCIMFLVRRVIIKVKRFEGIEMTKHSKIDANISLLSIMLLMASLLGLNMAYYAKHSFGYAGGEEMLGAYPIAKYLSATLSGSSEASIHLIEQASWWAHVLAVYAFANFLPYSKHFHVFMSVPNVFMSRLDPLTKMENMPAVTKEVKLMMDPNADPYATPPEGEASTPERFGVKDVEDVPWTSYIDSLACTQCGRCTDVCPANITGKKLSPRKIMVDLRHRMDEKGNALANDPNFDDQKSLIGGDYISHEELWACTTCNACSAECPINIDQPSIILNMRRYLVMEESAIPASLATMMSNIENNGAPWQYAQADRMVWAEDLEMKIN